MINNKDLTEAEEIKKRWQEYTELYKKTLNDLDNHDGMATHLKSDTLEYKVKWDLGSITMNKDSGSVQIPAELFQILKDDAVKSCTQYFSKFGKLTVATGLEKISFHFCPKEGQCQKWFKLPYNCIHFTCKQGNTQNPSTNPCCCSVT